MKTATQSGWIAYGVALIVVVADQVVKAVLLGGFGLEDRGPVRLFGPLDLRLVWNQGISFGLFRYDLAWTRWALAAFALAVAAGLAVWAWRGQRRLTGVAVGLIIGGAVGNLIDRVRFGAVADFIDATRLYFPWVFNIADSAISVGIALLIAESLLAPGQAGEKGRGRWRRPLQ
jgi:signal peptidase II